LPKTHLCAVASALLFEACLVQYAAVGGVVLAVERAVFLSGHLLGLIES
jgi:hypothetical protein